MARTKVTKRLSFSKAIKRVALGPSYIEDPEHRSMSELLIANSKRVVTDQQLVGYFTFASIALMARRKMDIISSSLVLNEASVDDVNGAINCMQLIKSELEKMNFFVSDAIVKGIRIWHSDAASALLAYGCKYACIGYYNPLWLDEKQRLHPLNTTRSDNLTSQEIADCIEKFGPPLKTRRDFDLDGYDSDGFNIAGLDRNGRGRDGRILKGYTPPPS